MSRKRRRSTRARRAWLFTLGQLVLVLSFMELLGGLGFVAGSYLLLATGVVLGLLLTFNLLYNLRALTQGLERLASNVPGKPLSLRWRWPLTPLFRLLNMLGQRTNQQGQAAQQTGKYRDQLLQQVGKTAAQEERNRLARDLHDSIKQQIFSIAVSTAAVKVRWEHDGVSARKTLDDIEVTAREAQVEMQALLQQLRPVALENVGLIESLRTQCQALGYRTGALVRAELGELPTDEQIPLGTQETLFRIVQEGFANIARHARASSVWLSLRRQNHALLLEIGDDGQGFDLPCDAKRSGQGGMGLANVRERVGTLGGSVTIWSQPGNGTTLHIYVPLLAQPAAAQPVEELDPELADDKRATHRISRFGMIVAELTIACILFSAPLQEIIVGMGLLLSAVAWIWSSLLRGRVAREIMPRERLTLQAAGHDLLARVLWLALFYAGDFTLATRTELAFPVFLGFAGICAPAAFICSLLSRSQGNAALLLQNDPGEQYAWQLDRLAVDTLAWCGVASLTPLIDYTHSDLPIAGPLMLLAWLLVVVMNWIQLARWRFILKQEGING